ncbi:hypothetical protein HPP92_018426 [Vanilla planifolia]|uniref:Uncharacterized protein n=1 Tax=Vanilla planifolia TaxID=51239 RepID=A0A835QI18_VANPL|nr:hypothetical protein HPP92_019039 [Vanilla planifolia]KAG0469098.1 hypothetical protein HPP92_018426 [Vanilla planifolia]
MSIRIHPKGRRPEEGEVESPARAWTVWKKSSMAFVGTDGFSVYDGDGKLAFRVENYARMSKYRLGEILLMDAVGRPVICLRPKILSMHDQWNGYVGDGGNRRACSNSLLFTMKRPSVLCGSGKAVVFLRGSDERSMPWGRVLGPDFIIEGSFRTRCCEIHGVGGEALAWTSPKKVGSSMTLGDDVFALIVVPGVSHELIVAFIVVMDRMYSKTFAT